MVADLRSSGRSDNQRELIGSTLPRVYTKPLTSGPPGPCGCGCALTPETSDGFEAVSFAEDVLGLDLIPWERWLLIHALEKLPDGSPRFRVVLVLVARQNGKSTVLQILSLWSMYLFGRKLVIGTAQNLDVAEEVWEGAVEMAESVPALAAEIEQISRVNGKKFLRLATRERYKVAAATRRGGRGLSGDLVLLDELREHQSWDAWAAVTKTTMARALAQIWGASNAGDASSIVLRYLRKMAHLALGDPDGLAEGDTDKLDEDAEEEPIADDDMLALFEWSAPPGCHIMDPEGWKQANPSLGYTITERAIRSAARTDPEWVFRTEVLCQWIDHTLEGPFPPGAWKACADEESSIADDSKLTFCVDVSWDRTASHVAVAGWRADGLLHGEVVESGAGVDWLVDWLLERPDYRPVVLQSKRAPASSLIEVFEAAGIDVELWDGVSGTAELYDRIRSASDDGGSFRHLNQPLLSVAAQNAVTRPVGDNWAWDRRRSALDISPLVAVTGAVWFLTSHKKPAVTPRVINLSDV